MKQPYRIVSQFFTLVLVMFVFTVQAAVRTSTAKGGTWTTGSTWKGGVILAIADIAFIHLGTSRAACKDSVNGDKNPSQDFVFIHIKNYT